jgi:hypothetical protein
MADRRSESHFLLWAGLGCGGAALALLVLGGGVTALWALGYLGPRRGRDVASAGPGAAPVAPAVDNAGPPGGPPANPFGNPAGGRLSANGDKLRLGMTEAEVRGLLGEPMMAIDLPAELANMAGRVGDQMPAKSLHYVEGPNVIGVHLNSAGRLIRASGALNGKVVLLGEAAGNPFAGVNVAPGVPPNPFAPGGGAPAPAVSRTLFDRVRHGMSEAEVLAVLGPPTAKLGPLAHPRLQTTDTWQWTAGLTGIKVHFRDGRVVGKDGYNLR